VAFELVTFVAFGPVAFGAVAFGSIVYRTSTGPSVLPWGSEAVTPSANPRSPWGSGIAISVFLTPSTRTEI
jgi:hypothetical protein